MYTQIRCCRGHPLNDKWATSWQNQQNDMCAQWRLRSAWASAQFDQSSLCAHWVAKTPITQTLRQRCNLFVTKKTDNHKEEKGFTKVASMSPQGLRSVAELNRTWAVFWACTKDWPQLIWPLRGFIGLREVSKQSYFHRRLVSNRAAISLPRQGWELFAILWQPIRPGVEYIWK